VLKSVRKIIKKKKFTIYGFILRLVPSFVLVLLCFHLFGRVLVAPLLPLFSREIELLHPWCHVENMSRETGGGRDIIVCRATIHRNAEKETIRSLNTKLSGGIETSFLYIHPIIIYSLIFAWPSLTFKNRMKAVLISLPLLVAVELIDIPVTLAATHFNEPYILENSGEYSVVYPIGTLQVFWNHVMNNGGRQFLALLVSIIAIAPFHIRYDKSAFQQSEKKALQA